MNTEPEVDPNFDDRYLNSSDPSYRSIKTFRVINVVPTEFMTVFHAACSKADPKDMSQHLLDYVNEKLRHYDYHRDFLLAGYVRDAVLEFSHAQKEKSLEDFALKEFGKTGVLLAPWSTRGYIFLLYQDGKLPAAVVRDVYPEERIITCAASWQSTIYGKPSESKYSLDEIFNGITNIKTVGKFKPNKTNYNKLEKKWVLEI